MRAIPQTCCVAFLSDKYTTITARENTFSQCERHLMGLCYVDGVPLRIVRMRASDANDSRKLFPMARKPEKPSTRADFNLLRQPRIIFPESAFPLRYHSLPFMISI